MVHKMMRTIFYSALVALSASTAIAEDICTHAPYESLPCLKNKGEANYFCGNATQTVTEFASTTTIAWMTETTSQDATSQKTIYITDWEFNTITSTVTTLATVTASQNNIQTQPTADSSNTTDSSPSASPTQHHRRYPLLLLPRTDPTACNATAVLASFTHENHLKATACSCLGLKVPQTTTTITQTFAAPSTTTLVQGRPSTTTQRNLGQHITTTTLTSWTTLPPQPTPEASSSKGDREAPAFKAVHGPLAGCRYSSPAREGDDDDKAVASQRLATHITSSSDAAAMCQVRCVQQAGCRHVWVQQMFAGWRHARYGGAEPYFECSFSEHKFDPETDLKCGQSEGKFGNGEGFDVVGR